MSRLAENKKRVVIISGYFTCAHRGHCEYAKLAKEFAGNDGIVICIVNNDHQSILKKGYSFVPEQDRLAIMGSLKYIDKAILSVDEDRTVCNTIQKICDEDEHNPTHMLNGGDVTENNLCPEEEVCKKNNIECLYGFGDKVQSTSWILENSVKLAYEKIVEQKDSKQTYNNRFNKKLTEFNKFVSKVFPF